MECEMSDDSFNLKNGSFTSKSTISEQEAISKKIAKLKKRIFELEDISIVKEESIRLIVAERLYRLCSTTEFVICLLLRLTSSMLNISKIPETQDTTVLTNNRIKGHKPNGNSKRAKKETHADHNAFIDTNKSNTNLLKKNIRLAFNISEMLETQDTTFSTNNRTRVHKLSRKKAKKGKKVDYNALANVDESDPNNSKGAKKGKQDDHNAPIDVDEIDPNNTKKEKQVDHNASIDVDESNSNLSEKDISKCYVIIIILYRIKLVTIIFKTYRI
ncbi:37010_t:CDS:2, partial [Gigaspora margarita]